MLPKSVKNRVLTQRRKQRQALSIPIKAFRVLMTNLITIMNGIQQRYNLPIQELNEHFTPQVNKMLNQFASSAIDTGVKKIFKSLWLKTSPQSSQEASSDNGENDDVEMGISEPDNTGEDVVQPKETGQQTKETKGQRAKETKGQREKTTMSIDLKARLVERHLNFDFDYNSPTDSTIAQKQLKITMAAIKHTQASLFFYFIQLGEILNFLKIDCKAKR